MTHPAVVDHDTGELLPARAQPMLPIGAQDAEQVMRAYQELCKSILTPDDLQRVDDKEFVKRSGFQKLAAAYGVSTQIVSLDVERDDTGGLRLARAVARATHPSGRHAEGDGACSRTEKRFRRGGEKIEHDLPATAVTRATNRAISNLVAFGSVSAEEAEAGDHDAAPVGLPGWAHGVGDDQLAAFARKLVQILTAIGVDEPAKAVGTIGQMTMDECDNTLPLCAVRVVHRIAASIPATNTTESRSTDA